MTVGKPAMLSESVKNPAVLCAAANDTDHFMACIDLQRKRRDITAPRSWGHGVRVMASGSWRRGHGVRVMGSGSWGHGVKPLWSLVNQIPPGLETRFARLLTAPVPRKLERKKVD